MQLRSSNHGGQPTRNGKTVDGYIADNRVLDSRQFYLAVRRLADSLGYGTDRSAMVGTGIEFVQSRPYQAGDPIRAIDWRVTARTHEVYVKEYEAPRRMPVYLLVDTSASMTVRSTARSKYELAVFVAGGIALACLDRISPVGVLSVGARSLHVRPSLSRDEVMQWIYALRSYDHEQATHLAARVAQLDPQLAQRTLVIVLSDLHDVGAVSRLKRLGQRHDCVVLQLQDPAEVSPHRAGFLRAREAETGRMAVLRSRTQWYDPAAVADELKRAAIDHFVIDTERPFVSRLRHFMRSRGLLGRGAR